MKNQNRFPSAAWIVSGALLFSSSIGLFNQNAKAQSERAQQAQTSTGAQGQKVSSDLRELVRGARSGDETVRVILQTRGEPGRDLQALLQRDGVKIRDHFQNLHTRVVELPASMVEELAADSDVSYVSPDRDVKSSGHVSVTTGADAVRPSMPGGGGALDGSGIGIAVLDS